MHAEGELKPELPTVYVVDDDESIRELLAWLMSSNGIAVAAFAGAQQFLKSYRAGAPGCLVVDLYMPGMSGLELQHYLIEHDIVIPVIFMSARADVAKAVSAVKQGAIDFIEKDQLTSFERARAFLNDIIGDYTKEKRIELVKMVWAANNLKGYVTEMEATAMLRLARDWKVEKELIEMVLR